MNSLPTPQQYVGAASLGYTGFRDTVVTAAKRYLAMVNASSMSTKELTDALWPNHLAHGTDIEIRKRMVDTLLKCATRELSMCARKGPVMGKAYGHAKRPWLWSAPPVDSMAVWAGEPDHVVDHISEEDPRPTDENGIFIVPPRDPTAVKQTIVDCIGASPAGQFLTVRDRAKIADEIMSKTSVTLL